MSLLKTIFSEHSIPAYVFTDQGRQFTLAKFQEFARYYQFEILHSTSRFLQCNGFIKTLVIIVKQTITKAEVRGKKPSAMLAYRGTQRGPGKLNPAEAMTQHKFRALLPIKQHLFAQLMTMRELQQYQPV